MKFNQLQLRNFRPFYGVHSLDLSLSGNNNLILVFAENMRGKTALLNAIRWVLYGHASDRLGEPVPIFRAGHGDQLLNKVAATEGAYQLSLELKFEHQGNQYDLRREAVSKGTPSNEADFTVSKHLRINGNAVAREQVDPIVRSILHEEISRFSLFDGEMLSDYEKLLSDSKKEIDAVKEAIERTLGLPALTHSHMYLETIKGEFEKSLNTQLRREKRNEATISRIEELDDKIESDQKDISQLKELLSRYTQEKSDAERDLRQHEDISKSLAQISEIENEITSTDRDIEDLQVRIRDTLQRCWWLPLGEKLKVLKAQAQSRLKHEVDAKNSALMRRQLKNSLDQKRCVLCGTDTGKAVGTRIKKHLKELESAGKPSQDLSYEGRLAEQVDFFDAMDSERAVERLLNCDERIMQLETIRTEKLSRIRSMKESLGDYSKEDHESKVQRYSSADDSVKEIKGRIENKERRIAEMISDRDAEQRKLQKASGADESTYKCSELSRLIYDAFGEAIDSFRNRARMVVSDAANEIFKLLTTERAFRGLRINGNYGLTILDSEGKEVSGRSAGAEQIVALSLIGGLNRAAVAGESPVVMDTNFGRLDRSHRENVLRWAASLDQQVILLVHSGELVRDDLRDFGIEYARAYEIGRINEWKSEVVECHA